MDGHLTALLGGADADLLASISILARTRTRMRFAEQRRLRVAPGGSAALRVGGAGQGEPAGRPRFGDPLPDAPRRSSGARSDSRKASRTSRSTGPACRVGSGMRVRLRGAGAGWHGRGAEDDHRAAGLPRFRRGCRVREARRARGQRLPLSVAATARGQPWGT